MTTFNDRENAYENKYAHDRELEFKINARRNKLVGLWAAEMMHMKQEDAEAYAKKLIMADISQPGEDDVVSQVMEDFRKTGISVTEKEVREKMHIMLNMARAQVQAQQ